MEATEATTITEDLNIPSEKSITNEFLLFPKLQLGDAEYKLPSRSLGARKK